MNSQKVFLAGMALALMTVGAAGLVWLKSHQKLGPPGVKTRPLPNSGNLLVELPRRVPGFWAEAVEQPKSVIQALPADTSFGCVLYTNINDGFPLLMNVVLMGTDRTSIHKPEYCLEGQGWRIDTQETVTIPMSYPVPYDLAVKKFTATRQYSPQKGQVLKQRAIYVFWFVAGDRLAADHSSRMWEMGKEVLKSGVLQRWAYVSVLTVCAPGREEPTFERMKNFITQTVPQFQLVPAPPSERADSGVLR